MRTNRNGVTENAEYNINKEVYDSNYVHIFQKDKCPCEDCTNKRKESHGPETQIGYEQSRDTER